MSDPALRALRFDDLLEMRRASRAVVTPDGKHVIFVAVTPDLENNRNQTDLFRVSAQGGDPVRLTFSGSLNADPAPSPDGRHLAFTSNRSGTPQIWILPMQGGEARQVTQATLGMSRPVWFPGGDKLLAVSSVYPDSPGEEAIKKREEKKGAQPEPQIIDDLMFRHWDSWTEGKVDHLFSVDAVTGESVDLTPGPYPAPPRSLTGSPDYAVSPDGAEVCFVSLRHPDQALSTNTNLWVIPSRGGEPRRISPWEGSNAFPAYSPDGKAIAYCGMRTPGYEADQRELLIYDRKSGATREVLQQFHESAGPPAWLPDGKRICFAAEERGRTRLFVVPAAGGEPVPITGDATDGSPSVAPHGDWLAFVRQTEVSPPEVQRVDVDGGDVKALTQLNRSALKNVEMNRAEDFWFAGSRGEQVHGMLIRPPQFDPEKKYPVVFLIHGGPQGMFGLDFHERWNSQLFASPGFVTVMINPRGSTGYGQAFTDAIRGEWGGDCYRDMELGFDHVLDRFPFCDGERTAAAGASFGGFMVNWIAGKTDRFKCLVSHDGIFNTEMMDYATDELWFSEWEFGGAPWQSPEEYRKWSPHLHVEKMKTPMLVIQGEQDFRCVVNEGLTLFTALRRRGVKARLLYLSDEGHWVVKPKNRTVWYATVLQWLEEHLKH